VHEIKHDGYRLIARRTDNRVRLYTRRGFNSADRYPLIVEALRSLRARSISPAEWSPRFPQIVEALARLRSRSCIIDGEAVACGDDGIACFELIRRWDTDQNVFMWAFDLIELDGADMRREPLIQRKALLERALGRASQGVRFNEHLDEEDGPLVFHHACKLGLEGIVSKQRPKPNLRAGYSFSTSR
jgi:bifunctional non-homologous end joining protein LigD